MNSTRHMNVKPKKPRAMVELTAVWGGDDADSTIKVGLKRWKEIQEGAVYEKPGSSWYEGRRTSVAWKFSDGRFSIRSKGRGDFEDMECVDDMPIEELIVQMPRQE
jgi:hypothetical protein